jgi:hypothetical protein
MLSNYEKMPSSSQREQCSEPEGKDRRPAFAARNWFASKSICSTCVTGGKRFGFDHPYSVHRKGGN